MVGLGPKERRRTVKKRDFWYFLTGKSD
jgi:hypothetical protein